MSLKNKPASSEAIKEKWSRLAAWLPVVALESCEAGSGGGNGVGGMLEPGPLWLMCPAAFSSRTRTSLFHRKQTFCLWSLLLLTGRGWQGEKLRTFVPKPVSQGRAGKVGWGQFSNRHNAGVVLSVESLCDFFFHWTLPWETFEGWTWIGVIGAGGRPPYWQGHTAFAKSHFFASE